MAHPAAICRGPQRDFDARLAFDDHLLNITARRLDDGGLAADHRVVAWHDGYRGDAVAPTIFKVLLAGVDRVHDGEERYVIVLRSFAWSIPRELCASMKPGSTTLPAAVDHLVVGGDRKVFADRLNLANSERG